MAGPGTLLIILFVAIPAVQTIIFSLQRVAPGEQGTFVGLANYQRLFASSIFIQSLWTTVVFALSFFLVSTVVGLGIGLLLNEPFRGRSIARTLLIVPWATPWIVVGIMWHWFSDSSIGWLNGLLYQVGIVHAYYPFLADQRWAFILLVVATSWRQSSLAGLLFLAGLQTIPKELMEAAALDGARTWQRFRYLTLPWLRPIALVVAVINVLYGFLQFDVIFIMTEGGPGTSTLVLSMLMYRELFYFTNTGVGSAVAVVLALLALVAGFAFVLLLHRNSSRFELSANY
jgi:ABC-type sugar transport system permease subunit